MPIQAEELPIEQIAPKIIYRYFCSICGKEYYKTNTDYEVLHMNHTEDGTLLCHSSISAGTAEDNINGTPCIVEVLDFCLECTKNKVIPAIKKKFKIKARTVVL